VYIIPKIDFETWLKEEPSVAQHFMNLLAQQNKHKNRLLLQMAYSSVRKRVAEGLLRLHHKYAPLSNSKHFDIHISREALANLVGTTKETVTRVLREFKTSNWIELKGSHLILLQLEELEDVPD
jgi:CRP-like cAMP-binding protein